MKRIRRDEYRGQGDIAQLLQEIDKQKILA